MTSLTQHTVLTADGARLAAFSSAAADAQTPTVVLSHGWTLSHESWQPVLERLTADGNYRVVTWDQRGHGSSTFGAGSKRPQGESVRRLGADLGAVIDAVVPPQSPLILGGHSMGGMTIMALASARPELFETRVQRVLLASTAISGLRGRGFRGEDRLMRGLTKVPGRLGKLIRPQDQRKQLFGKVAERQWVSEATRLTAATPLRTFGAFHGALMQHDERVGAAVLGSVPVTVVVGTADKLTSHRLGRELAEAVPGARLVELDGVGHMTPYESTDVLVEALTS